MAVRIRLKRMGRRNRPFYRMCVFDGRTRRDGQPVEELGSYDPRGETTEQKLQINRKRAHYWLTVGALPSETCRSLLRHLGVRKDGPVPEDEPVAVAAPAAVEVAPVAVAGEAPAAPDVEPAADETASEPGA
jgi:small subunit ribosomal protein S16